MDYIRFIITWFLDWFTEFPAFSRFPQQTGMLWAPCGGNWPRRFSCRTGKQPWKISPDYGRPSTTTYVLRKQCLSVTYAYKTTWCSFSGGLVRYHQNRSVSPWLCCTVADPLCVLCSQSVSSPLQSLQQRTWLIHWSLFVFFNHPKGRDNIIELFLYQPQWASSFFILRSDAKF